MVLSKLQAENDQIIVISSYRNIWSQNHLCEKSLKMQYIGNFVIHFFFFQNKLLFFFQYWTSG